MLSRNRKLSWTSRFLKMIIIHQEHNHNFDEKENIDNPDNNIKAINKIDRETEANKAKSTEKKHHETN